MKVSKAIIPIAGWGTRRLPITKVIEKSMLPVGNRPIVDYVVEDCILAGIKDIYFVISEVGPSQVKAYYEPSAVLERYLIERAKLDKLELIRVPEDISFHYIVQPDDGRYGTAVPVALARDAVPKGERAVVLMGDDFIYNPDGSSEVKRLIAAVPDDECGLLAARQELRPGGTFGLIVQDEAGYYQEIVDQPTVADNPPSNLANISKYIMDRRLMDLAAELEPAYNGEYQVTEAVNQYVAEGGKVKVVPAQGQYLDGGSLRGWLHANSVVCGDQA